MCSLLVLGEYSPFVEFAIARGISRDNAIKYARLCVLAAGIDEDPLKANAGDHMLQTLLARVSETLHPDMIRAFCYASSRSVHILFVRAVARDLAPRGTSSRGFNHTRHIAECIHPMTVVVKSNQCIKYREGRSVLIARGEYDAFAYAAIILGAYHAPIEQIMDLARVASDQDIAMRALNAFCAAGIASADESLIADYRNFAGGPSSAAKYSGDDRDASGPPRKNMRTSAVDLFCGWMGSYFARLSRPKRSLSEPPMWLHEPVWTSREVFCISKGMHSAGSEPHGALRTRTVLGVADQPELPSFGKSVFEYVSWVSVIERIIDAAVRWFFS